MPDILLALEASATHSSLTLAQGELILFERTWQLPWKAHSLLFEPLEELMPLLEKHKPSLLLVGSGPGSYSGIRVALAVADGFSLMWGVPVVALCSWEALSLPSLEFPQNLELSSLADFSTHFPAKAVVLSDARRGGWVCARLTDGQLEEELFILEGEKRASFLKNAQQEGYTLVTTENDQKAQHLSSDLDVPSILAYAKPSAKGLLAAWKKKTEEQKTALLTQAPTPLYVRPPHITLSSKKSPLPPS